MVSGGGVSGGGGGMTVLREFGLICWCCFCKIPWLDRCERGFYCVGGVPRISLIMLVRFKGG